MMRAPTILRFASTTAITVPPLSLYVWPLTETAASTTLPAASFTSATLFTSMLWIGVFVSNGTSSEAASPSYEVPALMSTTASSNEKSLLSSTTGAAPLTAAPPHFSARYDEATNVAIVMIFPTPLLVIVAPVTASYVCPAVKPSATFLPANWP